MEERTVLVVHTRRRDDFTDRKAYLKCSCAIRIYGNSIDKDGIHTTFWPLR